MLIASAKREILRYAQADTAMGGKNESPRGPARKATGAPGYNLKHDAA